MACLSSILPRPMPAACHTTSISSSTSTARASSSTTPPTRPRAPNWAASSSATPTCAAQRPAPSSTKWSGPTPVSSGLHGSGRAGGACHRRQPLRHQLQRLRFHQYPQVTLTTGKPVLDANGQLQRFNVQGGSISIDGVGLNADNVDQFDIITRSADQCRAARQAPQHHCRSQRCRRADA